MRVLAFDTENTGLPLRPPASLVEQPYVVQIAGTLYNPDRRPIYEFSTLVSLPDSIEVPERPFEVHGISADMTRRFGVHPKTAIGMLGFAVARADVVIAHNLDFDWKLINFLCAREGIPNPISREVTQVCTCNLATPIVKAPPTERMIKAGMRGPKRASLAECFQAFFSEEIENAHDALVDTRACARVYYHIMDMEAENE